jgi:hypothetical protein
VKIYGNSWRLKVYPYGNLNGKGTHVSVFLELRKGPPEKGTYSYRIELNSSTAGEGPTVREYASEFVVSDSWGWNKAIAIDKVLNHGYLSEDESLTIHLKLKPETYYSAYKDLKVALEAKKRKYRELKRLRQKRTEEDGNA